MQLIFMTTKIFKVIVPIILVTLPFAVPPFHLSADIGIFLTVISLLFAILIGFFISGATSNYLRMQTLISSMNTSLISLHSNSAIINAPEHAALTNAIDTYLIATLDYDLLDFSGLANAEFDNIINLVDQTRAHDDIGNAMLRHLHYAKADLVANDEEIAITAKTIVNPEHWLILVILASLIVVLLLSMRDNSIAVAVIVAALNFTILHILILLYELDANIFLAKKLAFQAPQRVFLSLGLHPYFPDFATTLSHVTLPKQQTYRVGTLLRSGKRKINLVKAGR